MSELEIDFSSDADEGAALEGEIAKFWADPLGFVLFAFPWGEGRLADWPDGPDDWQRDLLNQVGEAVRAREESGVNLPVRVAVASGHGVGKSALVSWLILWLMSTRPFPAVVVTANTQPQLSGKTWRELAKWHKLAINADWFEWTATKFYLKAEPEDWFANAVAWSENNPEAFAGLHEEHVALIMDEASNIADIIWETAEGAMTTAGSFWFVFGNPTRNSGRFFECFHGRKERWRNIQIDARNARAASSDLIEQWINDYGADSDFCRVRIYGQFPRAGDTQFIPTDVVDQAQLRNLAPNEYYHLPIVIGVDVARFGMDTSVIVARQGYKLLEIKKFYGIDTMELAGHALDTWRTYTAQAIFVDGTGMGAGVVDRLSEIEAPVVDVQVGTKPMDQMTYFNKRAELWGRMRDWLRDADIPKDPDLHKDLTQIEYGFRDMRIQLEKKQDMKRRGLSSPDNADALALTFEDVTLTRRGKARRVRKVKWR